MMDYLIYREKIDVKKFNENILKKILYSSRISLSEQAISITIEKGEKIDE